MGRRTSAVAPWPGRPSTTNVPPSAEAMPWQTASSRSGRSAPASAAAREPSPVTSRALPAATATCASPSRAFTRVAGPIVAGAAELARNPRARSAKLRFGIRGSAALAEDVSALADLVSLPRRGPERRRRK